MAIDPDGKWIWLVIQGEIAAYDAYKAYNEGKRQGKTGWQLMQHVAWAVGGNFIKVGKVYKFSKRLTSKAKGVGKAVLSKKSVFKNAQLPTSGKIRYVPPSSWSPSQPLPKTKGGYIDKFGNVWTKGPSRTKGQSFEWDVQLSKTGKNQLGHLSRDGSHLNVSLDGRITHK